jgi:hypothetical protein
MSSNTWTTVLPNLKSSATFSARKISSFFKSKSFGKGNENTLFAAFLKREE